MSFFSRVLVYSFLFILFNFSRTYPVLLASHIMTGNISYEYLGEFTTGIFSYKIKMTTFLDCTSPYWGSGFPETSLELGVYEGNISNSYLIFNKTFTLPLIDSIPFIPILYNNCAEPLYPCIYKVDYSDTLELPMSFEGYHLYYERCCRNNNIVNFTNPELLGLAIHLFIPPSIIQNSPPILNDTLVYSINAEDTFTIFNSMFDPDGDILLYSFVDPYEGENTDPGNPLFSFPDTLNWPFSTVTWQTGFDKDYPFGQSGFAYVNSANGISRFMSKILGNFSLTLEVKEYRNNTVIGLTRKNFFFIFFPSPGSSDFTADSVNICSGTVNFTDLSSNNPVSWLWNFGDGDSSTLKNPTHYYVDSGSYSVSLTAFCSTGEKTTIKNNFITKSNSFCAVGEEELLNNQGVLIFPNPSNGKFAVSSSQSMKEIQLFNLLGQNIFTISPNDTNDEELDLSTFPDGIYYLKMQASENYYVRKIILEK